MKSSLSGRWNAEEVVVRDAFLPLTGAYALEK